MCYSWPITCHSNGNRMIRTHKKRTIFPLKNLSPAERDPENHGNPQKQSSYYNPAEMSGKMYSLRLYMTVEPLEFYLFFCQFYIYQVKNMSVKSQRTELHHLCYTIERELGRVSEMKKSKLLITRYFSYSWVNYYCTVGFLQCKLEGNAIWSPRKIVTHWCISVH